MAILTRHCVDLHQHPEAVLYLVCAA